METTVVIFCINTNEYLTEEMNLDANWQKAKIFTSYEEVEDFLTKNTLKIIESTGQIYFAGRKLHTLYYPAKPSLRKYWFEFIYQIFGLLLAISAIYLCWKMFDWRLAILVFSMIWANNISQRKL